MALKSSLLLAFTIVAISGCMDQPGPESPDDSFVGPKPPALLAITSEYWHSSSGMVRLVPGGMNAAPASCVLIFDGQPHDNATCTVLFGPEDTSESPWYLDSHFNPPKTHARPLGIDDLSIQAFDTHGAVIATWFGDLNWYYHEDYSGVMQ